MECMMEPKLLSWALIRRCHDYVLQVFMLQEKYPLYYTGTVSACCVWWEEEVEKLRIRYVREGAAVVTPPAKVRAEGRWGRSDETFYLETTFFGHF